ncbi:hypothetical protein ES702_02212 [subsurface metagenome]
MGNRSQQKMTDLDVEGRIVRAEERKKREEEEKRKRMLKVAKHLTRARKVT